MIYHKMMSTYYYQHTPVVQDDVETCIENMRYNEVNIILWDMDKKPKLWPYTESSYMLGVLIKIGCADKNLKN